MPLMGDWSDHLVRKLGQRIGYREATGLKSGMSGEAFEARLGKFLLFGVVRITVRRAVAYLRDQTAIRTVPGRGSYVVKRGS
jgi:hypothetical protein